MGHAIEPVGDHFPRHDGGCLTDENQEGSLEGVLGIVVAEEAAADPPDNGAVPPYQPYDSVLVPKLDETAQELLVSYPCLVLP